MPAFLASLLVWFRALFRRRRAPVLVLGNLAFARTLPRVFPEAGIRRGPTRRCACGGIYDEVLITTGGPQADPEVWQAYKLVVDGWACRACDSVQVPRFLEAEEVVQIAQEAQASLTRGDLDAAEHAMRRVIASWHDYVPARLDLALVLRARLREEQLGGGRSFVELGVLAQMEEQLGVVLGQPPSSERMAAVHRLVEALAACEQIPRARALLSAESARDDLGDVERDALANTERFLASRGDLYDRGVAGVQRLVLSSGGARSPLSETQGAQLARAMEDLERHLELAPDSWQTLFFLGKAEQRRGAFEASLACFERAALLTDSIEVLRELAGQLLELERNEEALTISRSVVERAPDDAGLIANLALAEVLTAKLEAARATVKRAIEADPNDAITQRLADLIESYRDGRRPVPKTLAEMEGRASKS